MALSPTDWAWVKRHAFNDPHVVSEDRAKGESELRKLAATRDEALKVWHRAFVDARLFAGVDCPATGSDGDSLRQPSPLKTVPSVTSGDTDGVAYTTSFISNLYAALNDPLTPSQG